MQKATQANVIILGLVIFTACDALKNKESVTVIDSTQVSLDSQISQAPVNDAPEDDGKGNYQYINTYLVDGVPDSTQFQTVRVTCAIKIEITKAEKESNDEREAYWQATEARSDSIWDATEHDSASIAEREEAQMTIADDDVWYTYIEKTAQEKLFFLDSLKIITVTVSEENYLKLVGEKGKVWMVDIRTKTEPGRTIIFFNKDKEPIILDRLDINLTLLRNYFFSQDNSKP